MNKPICWMWLMLAPVIVRADGSFASLQPIYTTETAFRDAAYEGSWSEVGSSSILFSLELDHANGYRVVVDGSSDTTLHFMRLGGETLADVAFGEDSLFWPPAIPGHLIFRFRLEGERLMIDSLGSNELRDRIKLSGSPQFLPMSEDPSDGRLLLGAPTADLRKFLLDCLKQPDAFTAFGVFEKAAPEQRAGYLSERSRSALRTGVNDDEAVEVAAQAAEAVHLVPDNADYWSTLGQAQFQMRRFGEALQAFLQAANLRRASTAEELAYRAMAHQQLGQSAQAKRTLEELRARLDQCGDDKSRQFCQAQEMIAPKGEKR